MVWKMKIEDINLFKLKEYSNKLAQKVQETGYEPDHVLYIERAGLLVAHEIAKHFDCPISGIYSSRSGTSIKSKVKFILRYLPRAVTHLLRNIEIKSNVHGAMNERNVYIESRFPPRGKNILIVDDAIDTGFSLKAVLDFLKPRGYLREHIKIAVLTTTQNEPVCSADVSLFEQVSFAFPWSYDSREYNESRKLYKDLKASL